MRIVLNRSTYRSRMLNLKLKKNLEIIKVHVNRKRVLLKRNVYSLVLYNWHLNFFSVNCFIHLFNESVKRGFLKIHNFHTFFVYFVVSVNNKTFNAFGWIDFIVHWSKHVCSFTIWSLSNINTHVFLKIRFKGLCKTSFSF